MFVLGHLGFSRALAQPFRTKIDLKPFFVGALLPDLIDKPIFYLFPNHIAGTRGYAHTLLFLMATFFVAKVFKSRIAFSIAIGVLAHLLLDNLGDYLHIENSLVKSYQTLFWPLAGNEFPSTVYLTMEAQANRLRSPYLMVTESIGLILLLVFTWRDWRRRTSRLNDEPKADSPGADSV